MRTELQEVLESLEKSALHEVLMSIDEKRRERELELILQHRLVHKSACEAFDQGMPRHEGPVYDEQWMTDHWVRVWDQKNAYDEGQAVKARFGDIDENPYHREVPFASKANIELEYAWDCGFKGKEF